jgi:hypothetical protein
MPIHDWGGNVINDDWEHQYVVSATWLTSTTTSDWWPRENRWTSNNTSGSGGDGGWHVMTYNGLPLTWGGGVTISDGGAGGGRAGPGAEALRAARDERAVARTAAQDRAAALLESMLPPEQVQRYRLVGSFEIIGSHGTLYRVNRGVAGNIEWIKPDGTVGGRLCAHPDMYSTWLPEADVHLSQLLALMTDERAFCRVANVHQGRRPPAAVAA